MISKRKNFNGIELRSNGVLSQFTKLDANLTYIYREQFWPRNSIQRDIYVNGWILYIAKSFKKKSVGITIENKTRWLDGSFGLFLPAFELVEWHIKSDSITWEAYRFNKNDDWSERPGFLFEWKNDSKIESKSDLVHILKNKRQYFLLNNLLKVSAVTEKTKNFLDKNYLEDLTLAEISNSLSLSHSTMTHYFKKDLGISPVKYRRLLRLAKAAYLISSHGNSVTKACYDSGFNEYTTFKDGFQKRYGNSPNLFSQN